MKCPKCGGTGEMQICEMGFIGKDECDECHGKGYLTNEEWRKNCSDEEFIKWIVGVCNLAVLESTYDVAQLRKKKYWEIWLKEKHNESV